MKERKELMLTLGFSSKQLDEWQNGRGYHLLKEGRFFFFPLVCKIKTIFFHQKFNILIKPIIVLYHLSHCCCCCC